jgi:hypothetical protein
VDGDGAYGVPYYVLLRAFVRYKDVAKLAR